MYLLVQHGIKRIVFILDDSALVTIMMFKTLVLIGACVACAVAQGRGSVGADKTAQIVRESSDVNIDGSYQWSFEADNGISAQETGQLKNANSQDPIEEAQGSFQFTAPDGTPIQLTYVANEGGFQPQGAHLPTAPPIPPEILKALEWNAAHPEEDDDGKTPPRRL